MAERKSVSGIAKGFRQRTLVTAKLGVKAGMKVAKTALNIGNKPLDEDLALEVAADLLQEIDALKGLVMKFGQMASYLGTTLPPQAQRILAKLQAEATALPFEQVGTLLEAELGKPLEHLFEQFDKRAFAAASIGQVHRAVFEGQTVAVKIQYPGVEEAIRSDFNTIGNLLLLGFAGARQNGKALLGELKQRVLEECDYQNEASNQRYFARVYRDHPGIIIPQVIAERSSKRVLTTELIEAKGFYDFRDHAEQELKNKAAKLIYEFAIHSIFQYGVFNADPHPGNYLFTDDEKVVFLDFGCVKRFSPQLVDNWKAMAQAVLSDDMQAFKKYCLKMGVVGNESKFDWRGHLQLMNHIYEPVKSVQPYTFSHEHVRQSYDWFFLKNKNRFVGKMPADFLFSTRLSFGMNSVLADLHACADWSEIFRAAVASPNQAIELTQPLS